MGNVGAELLQAIASLASETNPIEDVVLALGFLRSAVFGDPLCSWRRAQDAFKVQQIAKLADACTKEWRSNVFDRADLFGAILKLLLYRVAPDFLSGFTQEERELLFDAFFLKAPSTECVLALVSALTGDKERDGKPTAIVVQSERLLCKCLCENLGVKRLAEEFGQVSDAQQQRYITQIAQLVSSLPDRLRPDAPSSLTSRLFFSNVTSQLLDAARNLRQPSTSAGTLRFIGEMVCKLCRRGHADVIARETTSSLVEFYMTRKQAGGLQSDTNHWQAIVGSMKDFHALEQFGQATLLALSQHSLSDGDAHCILSMLLGSPRSQAADVRRMMENRFIFWKVFPLRVLKWILDYSVFYPPCDDKAGKVMRNDVVKSLAQTWSDQTFIQSASPEQQTYVTVALGICLKAMTKGEIEKTEGLLKFVLDGVSKRLESPLESVRRMAKQIALAFSLVINPESPLLLDESDSIQDLSDWDALGLLKGPGLQDDRQVKSTAEHVQGTSKSLPMDDPDAVVDLSKPTVSWMNDEPRESDDDTGSEASLKPYDLSDDESDLDKAKYPSQLSTCASNLRKGDDPDTVMRALEVCEKYVRLRPDELESSAADLAQALVHVRCSSVAVEGEEDTAESRRQRSLVALLACAPLTTATVLTKELYSVHVDISQRLMILDVLSVGAQELASGGAEFDEPVNRARKNAGPWKEVSHPYPGNSLLTLGQTYERELPPKPGQKELGKSRRWANRSLQLKKEKWKGDTTTRNKFAPVAPAFMLPIMRDYDKQRQGLDMLGGDYVVLAKMIQTLGICMDCLFNQVNAASLGTALLDMLRSRPIYNHPEPYVRRSVLFAVSRVLISLQPSYLVKMDASLVDALEWIKEWLLAVSSNDSDAECVKMAMACMHVHSELAFQTSRALEDENSLLPLSSSRRPFIVSL